MKLLGIIALLTACSQAGFTGGSSSDRKAGEETIEQPTDVTGGFGLACEQAIISEGSGRWDEKNSTIGCNALTASGSRLKDVSRNLKFEIKLLIDSSEVLPNASLGGGDFDAKFLVANNLLGRTDFILLTPDISGSAVKASVTGKAMTSAGSPLLLFCGEQGNSCYDNSIIFAIRRGKLSMDPSPMIELVKADPACSGANCFQIWKKAGSSEVLNASGYAAAGTATKPQGPWQRLIKPEANAWEDAKLLVHPEGTSTFAGRACPRYTMTVDGPNYPKVDRCLYYDLGTSDGGTNKGLGYARTGPRLQVWIDYFKSWMYSEGGAAPPGQAWYVGNHQTCSSKNMRLPILYEMDVALTDDWWDGGVGNKNLIPSVGEFPSGIDASNRECIFSSVKAPFSSIATICPAHGIAGIPGDAAGVWTATARKSTLEQPNRDHYFIVGGSQDLTAIDHDKYTNTGNHSKTIRCVLPSSHE